MRKQQYWHIIVFIMSIFFVFAQNSYATTVDKIIVFGDSMSDNGNIYSITKKLHKVGGLFPIIPKNPPYFEGRFTNGPVWIEDLATSMKVKLTDYAYGGSWVESFWHSGSLIPFSLGMQVNYYLVNEATDFHKDNHLYVIFSGSNDYIDGRKDANDATNKTVAKIKEEMDWLIYYGAKNFLLLTVPDVGLTPEAQAKGAVFVEQVHNLVSLHNTKLTAMITQEQKEHPNLKFVLTDINGSFTELYEHPDRYNMSNVKDACYGGGYWLNKARLAMTPELKAAAEAKVDILNNPALRIAYLNGTLAERGQQPCSEPDTYLFWDQIHPTKVVHSVLALLTENDLAANNIRG